ncbi:MAG: hypothetical protein IJV29_18545 [Butyrivibrio sp.]|nr:hypothetical protein [Butyrivibrio sp.]MBQ7431626.1 hypothetical protein [Butyrivibrio sp.]
MTDFSKPESHATPHHDDPYEGLSDEELKEIWEDMQADYWIDIQKSQISEQ